MEIKVKLFDSFGLTDQISEIWRVPIFAYEHFQQVVE